MEARGSTYDLYVNGNFIDNILIPTSGIHNVKNSLAAIATANLYKIPIDVTKNAILKHNGVERRFEFIGYFKNKHLVYDDYGHHPVELDSTFSVLSKMTQKSVVIFQPHKYSRTRFLWEDFLAVFYKYKHKIEFFYITDVYAAGDIYDNKYNSKNLVATLNKESIKAYYVPFDNEFINIINKINFDFEQLNDEFIVLCQGAGLLDRLAKKLIVENKQ